MENLRINFYNYGKFTKSFIAFLFPILLSSISQSAQYANIEANPYAIRELIQAQCQDVGGTAVGVLCVCPEASLKKLASGNIINRINPFVARCDGKPLTDEQAARACELLPYAQRMFDAASTKERAMLARMQSKGLLDLSLAGALGFPTVDSRVAALQNEIRKGLGVVFEPGKSLGEAASHIREKAQKYVQEKVLEFSKSTLGAEITDATLALMGITREGINRAKDVQAAREAAAVRAVIPSAVRTSMPRTAEVTARAIETAAGGARVVGKGAVGIAKRAGSLGWTAAKGMGKGLALGVGIELIAQYYDIDTTQASLLPRPAQALTLEEKFKVFPMLIFNETTPGDQCHQMKTFPKAREAIVSAAAVMEELTHLNLEASGCQDCSTMISYFAK